MLKISDDFILKTVEYQQLIESLKNAFRQKEIVCPAKTTLEYQSEISDANNKMMLMPAWDNKNYFGIKLITATPVNDKTDIPYLNGSYLLFDAKTGVPIAEMDAKLLTHIRTAATSVLGSQLLARVNASSVLIIGNGNIAPSYIEAYASMKHVDRIYLWGRNYSKTVDIVDRFQNHDIEVTAIKDFSDVVLSVDIVSCVTSAESPIILPQHLSEGQHYDLAGSYTTDMIEVSTAAVSQCSVYVDNMEVTPQHAGELFQAMQENKMQLDDIKGTLHDLCQDDFVGRKDNEEITLFKSTGMGVEDLVMAIAVYEKLISPNH